MRTRIWFDPPLFRWSRVLAVAVLGVAAAVGWIAYERGVWQPIDVGPPGVVLAAASGVGVTEAKPAPIRAPAAVVRAASVPEVSASAVRVLAADELDVCGRGIVKIRADAQEEELNAAMREWAESAIRKRWLSAMRASSDPKVQGAGLLLETRGLRDDEATERLVRLATNSLDAAVYGWALYACQPVGGRQPPGACLMLSYERWAALAPTQALPWLHLVSESGPQRRADPVEAMYRAARADTVGSSFAALPALALATQPPGVTPMNRYTMMAEAMGVSGILGVTRFPYPSRYCDAALLRDADRRQQCEAVAQLLANKAENPFDLAIAKALGSRLGWPADRLKAIGDEHLALQYASSDVVVRGQAMSCASIERLAAHVHEAARVTEVGAAREVIRRSGKSAAEYRAAAQKAAARLPPAASDASP